MTNLLLTLFLRAAAFGPQHDLKTRRQALVSARQHGLSVPAIALRTVELILSDTLASLPPSALLPSSSQALEAYGRIGEEQQRLIWGVEWLLMEKETYEEGLRWSNALARWFLCSSFLLFPSFLFLPSFTIDRSSSTVATSSPTAARLLLSRLPSDLLPTLAAAHSKTNDEPSTSVQLDIREHLDYVALFTTLEKQAGWMEGWRGGVAKGCVLSPFLCASLSMYIIQLVASSVARDEGKTYELLTPLVLDREKHFETRRRSVPRYCLRTGRRVLHLSGRAARGRVAEA